MSINSGYDYRESSLIEHDTLIIHSDIESQEPIKSTETVPLTQGFKNRPWGLYAVSFSIFAIIVYLTVKYFQDPGDSYYFTYPELSTSKGQELATMYYSDFQKPELTSSYVRYLDSLQTLIDNTPEGDSNLVVFDLDETLIDNYPIIKEMNFAWDDKKYDEWTNNIKADPILPTLDLINTLIEKEVKIAFITGRYESERGVTTKHLEKFGLEGKYVTLELRGKSDSKTASEYKLKKRAELAKEYRIIGCVGDQASDCTGSYTGVPFRIPNYLYLIL